MEALVEPPPKRRKISTDGIIPPSALPPPFSDYLVLGRTSLHVRPVDGLFDDAIGNASLTVRVRDVTPSGDQFKVGFSLGQSPHKKYVQIAHLTNDNWQILKDAQDLESTARYKSPAAPPLACSYATLQRADHFIRLEVLILWENTVAIRDKVDPILLEILARYLSPETMVTPAFEPWEPRDFYDNVHVPEKSDINSAAIKIPYLESSLYPFQRRAVRWLLSREGLAEQPDGEFQAQDDVDQWRSSRHIPHGFEELESFGGRTCFVNPLLGVACTDLAALQQRFAPIKGGLLADEMGLGKTLEIIALICLNPRPPAAAAPAGPRQSSATMIITPPSILEQWKSELLEHAPALQVFHYTGVSDYKKAGAELIDTLLSHDVVLTTYNVIAKEVHYAAEKPERNLRNGTKRSEPAKSPLTQISWWRVCLDEAQLVESGVSAAATVARLIPRTNAWAVTGTPLRKGHRDLFGLLLFLRHEPWCRSPRLWDHLVTYYRPLFRVMLGEVAMRHSKDLVREDLRLPPQSRHIITIPFTPIEEQHYTQLFQEFCEDCDLDRNGAPLTDDWDPEATATVEKMRTWLIRLRQTCLHPEVGGRNRRALGRNTSGPLRTVEEVLDVMIDQHEGQLRAAQRTYLTAKIRRGQLQENAKASDEALKIWREALMESTAIEKDCRAQFARARASFPPEMSQDTWQEVGDETHLRFATLMSRLRSVLEVQHMACFFAGNALFQLKSELPPETDAYQQLEERETAAYDRAKSIRAERLKALTMHVNKLVTAIRTNLSKDVSKIPRMSDVSPHGGIESRKIFSKIHHYFGAMNAQAEYFDGLRKKMADFLSQALIDEDEGAELQGDEYESSTKHQDEMYAYMEILRAAHADRAYAINGQENTLIKEEMKQFLRNAKEGTGPAPELFIRLLAEREQKRVKVNEVGSLRGILGEIRTMVAALQWQEGNNPGRAMQELAMLEPVMKHVQGLGVAQTKTLGNIEQEVNHFREAMNGRLEYYRALQRISDQVAPFREETVGLPLDAALYQNYLDEEAKLNQKVVSISAKLRYLVHMKSESKSTAPKVCVICTDDFEIGSMTACGHQFCKECVLLWWSAHHNCPVCKARLLPDSFHDITYKPAEIAVQAESASSSSTSSVTLSPDHKHDQSIYSDISTTMLNQIKTTDIRGPSYGSKIDFLCRHLLWLREHDPGSKSIIFTQYREFIDVLDRALTEAKISFTRIDTKNGTEKFKSEPAIECFLLHAKAHSAGLNLVVANHVFLCEPLINAAIELQAIARVHRIGQYRPTNVWMYLVADTVEESIYDISVSRRLAHMKSSKSQKGKGQNKSTPASASQSGTNTPRPEGGLQENAIDAANSMELQAADLSRLLAAGKGGGELVDKEDLWASLFGRVRSRDAGGLNAPAESLPANTAVGRFLRTAAADGRAAVPRHPSSLARS